MEKAVVQTDHCFFETDLFLDYSDFFSDISEFSKMSLYCKGSRR